MYTVVESRGSSDGIESSNYLQRTAMDAMANNKAQIGGPVGDRVVMAMGDGPTHAPCRAATGCLMSTTAFE